MQNSLSASVGRNNHLLHTPEDRNMRRVSSNDRFVGRSIPSTRPVEIPTADTNARYSISYLPGASEHTINTGKTLPEAQMKIVLFACEVERLATQNYELVRENEVLRTQVDKSQRERDLETKLAIVLAENEKLNQVIEELYSLYVTEKGGDSHETYERRIAELLRDLEEWKNRCQNLQGSQGNYDSNHLLHSLQEENHRLNEALNQRDRELEALRSRSRSPGGSGEVNALEEKIIWLVEENNKLKEELRLKPSGDNERALREYRQRINELMAENETLMKAMRSPRNETAIDLKPAGGEKTLKAGVQAPQSENQLQVLTRENEDLKKRASDAERLREKLNVLLGENERLNTVIQRNLRQIEELKAGQGNQFQANPDLLEKLRLITDENDKLNNILREKLEEIEKMRRQNGEVKSVYVRIEELNVKLKTLVERNNELNNLVLEKDNEVEELRHKLAHSEGGNDLFDELKGKLIMVTAENERLNQLLLERVAEVDRLRKQLNEQPNSNVYNVQIQNLRTEILTLNEALKEKERVNEELRRKPIVVQDSPLNDNIKMKVQLVSTENERLNQVVREQLTENEQLRIKISELMKTIEALQGELEKASRVSTERLSEIERLRAKVNELGNESVRTSVSDDLKTKIILISQENERLNTLLMEKMEDVDKLRRQLMELQASSSKVDQLNIQIRGLLAENDKLNHIVLEKARENEEIRMKYDSHDTLHVIEDLRMKLQLVTTENERLNGLVIGKVKETEELRTQLNSTRTSEVNLGEYQRLSNVVVEKNTEIEHLRMRLLELQTGLGAVDEWKKKFVFVCSENERLSLLLSDNTKELNELRQRSSNVQVNTYQIEIFAQEKEKLTHIIQDKTKENEELRRRIYELQANLSQAEELKSKFPILVQEIEKLNTLLLEKVHEIDVLRSNLGGVEAYNLKIKDLEERLKLSITENEKLNRIIFERVREVEGLKVKLHVAENTSNSGAADELRGKLVLLMAEIERLNGLLNQRNIEIQQLTIRVSQDQSDSSKVRIQNLMGENERLTVVLTERIREIEELKRTIARLEGSNQTYELQIRFDGLAKELEKHRLLIVEKDNELNLLRRRVGELEGSSTVVYTLQEKLLLVSSENQRLSDELDHLKMRLAQDSSKELEIRITEILRERESLVLLLNTRNQENEVLKKEIENLRNEHLHTVNTLSVDIGKHKEELKNVGVHQQRRNSELELRAKQNAELEERVKMMEGEIHKLVTIVNDREDEINRMKLISSKTESLQISLQQVTIENARLQELLNSTYKELETLRVRVTVIEKLENEAASLREKLEITIRQSEEYRARIYQLESSSGKIREIESLLEMVRGENGVLKKSLEDKIKYIEELEGRLRIAISEKERITLVLEEKMKEIDTIHREFTAEMTNIKAALDEKLKSEKRKLVLEKEELEGRLNVLVDENNQLKIYLNQTLTELEDLKKRYAELETLRSREMNEFKAQFEVLRDINKEIKELQIRSAAERTAYETQIAQLEMTITDLEHQKDLITGENERLTGLSVQRLEEGETSKRKILEVEEVYKLELTDLRAQIEKYKAMSLDVKELAIKYSADRSADQSQINQLKQLNENLKAEIEKLYELLDERKVDIEGLHKQNEELRASQSQLVVRLKQSIEKEDYSSQEQIERIRGELQHLEKARNEYKQQAERNSVELTRRNKDLVDKIQQLDVLKMKYEEALANYQALNSKLFERLSTTQATL